jgi:ATP-dependent Clp protease protease subunit
MILLPDVIEREGRNKKVISIPSRLFEENIVTMFGEVDDDMAYSIITQLLYLDTLDTDDSIKLYINSPGGSVYDGLAIHDCIRSMKRKVDTVCTGIAMSMGAFLLMSGTGTRKSLPNSRIMLHSVSSGTYGTVHDQRIDLKETDYLQEKLMKIQAEYSNISYDDIVIMTERDKYLSPQECKKLGIIDKIVGE